MLIIQLHLSCNGFFELDKLLQHRYSRFQLITETPGALMSVRVNFYPSSSGCLRQPNDQETASCNPPDSRGSLLPFDIHNLASTAANILTTPKAYLDPGSGSFILQVGLRCVNFTDIKFKTTFNRKNLFRLIKNAYEAKMMT
jgi:hypothetical protein